MKPSIDRLIMLQKDYDALWDLNDVLDKLQTKFVEEDSDAESLQIVEQMQEMVYKKIRQVFQEGNAMAKALKLSKKVKLMKNPPTLTRS